MTILTDASIHWPGQDETDQKDLLPLREDLKLIQAPPNEDGSAAWMLHDPVRQQFFRIGWKEVEILKRWPCGSSRVIVSAVNEETTLNIKAESVLQLHLFLKGNQLLNQPSKNFMHSKASPGNRLMSLMTGILYQKIPLFEPDAFLQATLPFVKFLFSNFFWVFISAAGLIGSYLTIRQWDDFIQTFLYFYSFQGIVASAAAITLVKAGHELAHAYTAKNYGLNIPVMGVVFILFWPVLYTDTTDAWRLKNKKDRIKIGIAGAAFEISVAVFATLLWHIVPPGPTKSILFVLAATNWITTLAINLNPFMRFDGYYILSDFLDIPNLQTRSFMLARWFLRELILGIKQPCPENLSLKRKTVMLVYAFSTWVYRFFLYAGIALVVYHLFFKLLGLIFFISEICILFLKPLIQELRAWAGLRARIKFNIHILLSLAVFSGCAVLLIFPWDSSGEIPGIYKAKDFSRIFASFSGQIKEVNIQYGQKVEKGDLLFVLFSPQISSQKKQAQLQVHHLQLQLSRISFAKDQAVRLHVVEQQLVEAMTKLDGAIQKENQLKIFSPISGHVSHLVESMIPGRWVNESDQLALIVNSENMIVEGYVHESDRDRIQKHGRGVFYPADTEEKKIEVLIMHIAPSHLSVLDEPCLASIYGGVLPVREDKDSSLVLQGTYYKIKMQPASGGCTSSRIQRGIIKFQGKKVSYVSKMWKGIQSVLIRESSF